MRLWTTTGALFGALAVALGAFGAHALKDSLSPEQLGWWETGVQYHALHALALVFFGLSVERGRSGGISGALFAVGIVLFSGTLYAMALGAPRWFGAITPLGGTAFIVAWLLFAVRAWRHGR